MDTVERVIERRAEQLAYLYLTHRSELSVLKSPDSDYGIDFLVRIRDRSAYRKEFGVEVKGRRSHPHNGNQRTDDLIDVPDVKQSEKYSRVDFPICIFLFFMDTDAGFFSWVREPILSGQGRLETNSTSLFKPLNDKLLDEIISKVRSWYELGRLAVSEVAAKDR